MMRFILIFLSIYYLIIGTASADVLHNFRILKVIDGDTVEIEATYLPDPLKKHLSLRLHGIDTPEKGFRAKCDKENIMSLNAKLFLEQEISNGKKIQIKIVSWDKYGGRVLGDIIIDNQSVVNKMIKGGYGVPYFGKGDKKDWCK
jgi:micrococcal nuclease